MNVVQVGSYLKEARKKLRLTQQQVADQIGISPQAISKWERGENMPDVAYFPDISRIYQISIEDILNSGLQQSGKDAGSNHNKIEIKLFDQNLFEQLIAMLDLAESFAEHDIPIDAFVYMSNEQKHVFLEYALKKPDYILALEEILSYTNSGHRTHIIATILEKKDFHNLETISTYLNNETKEIVLNRLLEEEEFGYIEDIITIFNRKHRNLIIDHLEENLIETEIVENLMPFFDKKQTSRLRQNYEI